MPDPSLGTPHSSPAPESLDSEILRMLMDVIPDRIYFKDRQSRFVRVNQAYIKWHGLASPSDVIGKTDFDLFAAVHAEIALAEEQEIMRTGQPLIAKLEQLTLRDGTAVWGSATKLAWRDSTGRIIGTFGITRDATATKLAEEKLTDERNLLRTIIDHLPARIFVKDADSRYLLNNLAHLQSLGIERQEQATGRTTSDFYAGERARQAMADDHQVLAGGEPIVYQEKSDFATDGNIHWSLTTKVPLRDFRGQITSLVGISHDITRRKRAEQELQHRTDEMETDLRMARQIQECFFPRTYPVFPREAAPALSTLRFAHRYLPAATLGGDFFDVLQISDTLCGVLVCDVMGHGVRAGLLTALIRGGVEELGARSDNPAYVLGEINRSLIPVMKQTGEPVFATTFYGVIDTAAGTMTFGNAGHPAPLVRRAAGGAVEPLALVDPEPAAGIMEEFVYSNTQIKFLPGDLLFAFTDGLFEATNPAGAMFGQERVAAIASQSAGISGDRLIDRLMQELGAFTGQATQEDDICLVTVESSPRG